MDLEKLIIVSLICGDPKVSIYFIKHCITDEKKYCDILEKAAKYGNAIIMNYAYYSGATYDCIIKSDVGSLIGLKLIKEMNSIDLCSIIVNSAKKGQIKLIVYSILDKIKHNPIYALESSWRNIFRIHFDEEDGTFYQIGEESKCETFKLFMSYGPINVDDCIKAAATTGDYEIMKLFDLTVIEQETLNYCLFAVTAMNSFNAVKLLLDFTPMNNIELCLRVACVAGYCDVFNLLKENNKKPVNLAIYSGIHMSNNMKKIFRGVV